MKRVLFVIVAMLALTSARPPKVENIILLIGDGMGPAQVTALMQAQGSEPINMERATVGGFVKTSSANNRVTDSAAAATAFATGQKTNNGHLGVNVNGEPLETILEKAEKAGLATGLVATTYLEHATPGAFYGHNADRNAREEISAQLQEAGIEVTLGQVKNLAEATGEALTVLTGKRGFFLMVEGSFIDSAGHDNDPERLLKEMRDFDGAVGVALDYAETHPKTLVIITADHETGGLTIPSGDENFLLPDSGIEFEWGTGGHSAVIVPLFVYGPGATQFGGVHENTEINHLMVKSLGLK